jgi:hypothetical protein
MVALKVIQVAVTKVVAELIEGTRNERIRKCEGFREFGYRQLDPVLLSTWGYPDDIFRIVLHPIGVESIYWNHVDTRITSLMAN